MRWYEFVAGQQRDPALPANSLIVGVATAIIATVVGHDGGARPAAGAALVPPPVRCADLRQHHRAGARHRPRDAGVLRQHDRTRGRSSAEADRHRDRVRLPHDRRRRLPLFNISLVLLLVRARLSGMDRTMVEASYDLFATPWRTFWQITFPQLLPAIVAGLPAVVHVRLRRLPDHDLRQRTRDLDDPALRLRPDPASGVTPGDQRGRRDDAAGDARDPARRPVPAHPPGAAAERAARWRASPGWSPSSPASWTVGRAVERPTMRRAERSGGATGSARAGPASDASRAALSVRSHGRSRSGRPKWPYAAVCR